MNKILSAICMVVLAGAMIFTSCTKKQYIITVAANPTAGGEVVGGGIVNNQGYFNDQDTITLEAIPSEGYEFVKWQDGSTDNPRTIIVTGDATYTAKFEKLFSETGVNVNFNGTHWTVHDVTGLYDSVQCLWKLYAQAHTVLPIIDIASSATEGSIHATADTSGNLNSDKIKWIEYYHYTFMQDPQSGAIHGDYWAKSATIDVSVFDATDLTLSSNIIATMFNAYEAFIDTMGVDSASTVEMMVDIRQLKLDKSTIPLSSKKVTRKLVPGK